jgi:hypothetical protein
MTDACIFCPNSANSKEDMFPKWILRRVKTGEPMVRQFEGGPKKLTESQKVRVRCVCKHCNNGWMSQIEETSIPLIGNLLEDVSLTLDTGAQELLAIWATKTAMIADKAREVFPFYRRDECEALREKSTIPHGTAIWIGRFTGRTLSSITGGLVLKTETTGEKTAEVHVFTMAIGHLVFQVLTGHEMPGHANAHFALTPNPGPWTRLLTPIHPRLSPTVTWPPALSFSNYGAHPYGSLVYRWRRERGHSLRPHNPTTKR